MGVVHDEIEVVHRAQILSLFMEVLKSAMKWADQAWGGVAHTQKNVYSKT